MMAVVQRAVGQRRKGSEVLAFFAANDFELSSWLDSRSRMDLAEIVEELDDALAALSHDRFEDRMRQLTVRRRDTDPGSAERARANAILRMLGYEYERVYGANADVGNLA